MVKRSILTVLVCLCVLQVKSQYVGAYQVNEGNCDFFIKDKNWPETVTCFSALVEKEPSNQDFQYKLAKGYTYSNIDKKRALKMLKKLDSLNYEADDFKAVYAMAHFYNYKFEAAKKMFTELAGSSVEEKAKYEQLIKQSTRAMDMMKNPVAVSFENLGKNINSNAPDFLPIVKPDESNVFFTTKRKGVVGNLGSSDGFKTADIFSAKHKRNKYSRARSIGTPNTLGNEFTAGSSENGKYMLYIVNNEENYYDLFISELGKRSYMTAKELKKAMLKKSGEQGATISNDGERLYFSSDLEGGKGGYDIYMMQRLPNGKWGYPKNLGAPINTAGDEKFPMLINNGKTLYFSSDGHPGMGDMDLFKSFVDKKTGEWKNPINLGYPINSPYDDLNISFAKNHRYAYMAKRLDDTFGDLDIYRLTFEEKRDDYSLLTGRVLNSDSIAVTVDVMIELFSEETDELVGTYKMNIKNGKYSMIIAPGRYRMEIIDVEGYTDFEKSLRVFGKNDLKKLQKMDIILQSQ